MTDVYPNSRPVSTQSGVVYSEWARHFVESLVEAERKWLELAAAQNELVVNTIRQGVKALSIAPTPALGEWARQGLNNFMEAQRAWTGNFNQQLTQSLNTETSPDTDRSGDFNLPPASQMTGMINQPIELIVDARRRWLELAAYQNTQLVESVKRSLGIQEGQPAVTYANWTEDAVNSYVEFQKRWLDLFVHLPLRVLSDGKSI